MDDESASEDDFNNENTTLTGEIHDVSRDDNYRRPSLLCCILHTILRYLSVLFFTFSIPSRNNRFQKTQQQPPPSETSENREITRTFITKLMALESLNIPRHVLEQYKLIHDPRVIRKVDDTVVFLHQINKSAVGLAASLRDNRSVTEEIRALWKQKYDHALQMKSQYINNLVLQVFTLPNGHLASVTTDSIQTAGESQARGDWLKANTRVISNDLLLHNPILGHIETDNINAAVDTDKDKPTTAVLFTECEEKVHCMEKKNGRRVAQAVLET